MASSSADPATSDNVSVADTDIDGLSAAEIADDFSPAELEKLLQEADKGPCNDRHCIGNKFLNPDADFQPKQGQNRDYRELLCGKCRNKKLIALPSARVRMLKRCTVQNSPVQALKHQSRRALKQGVLYVSLQEFQFPHQHCYTATQLEWEDLQLVIYKEPVSGDTLPDAEQVPNNLIWKDKIALAFIPSTRRFVPISFGAERQSAPPSTSGLSTERVNMCAHWFPTHATNTSSCLHESMPGRRPSGRTQPQRQLSDRPD